MSDDVSDWICVSRHRKDIATVPGLMVCGGCIRSIQESLPEVARLLRQAQDLTGVLSSKVGGGGRRGPSSKPPTDLDLLAIMDTRTQYDPGSDIAPVARWIIELSSRIGLERQMKPGKTYQERLAFIHRNIDYLATKAYAGDAVSRFVVMRRVLRRQCGEQRNVIDTCQSPIEDGSDCGGNLYQAEDGSASVECSKCGDKWTDGAVLIAYGELRRLGLILESGERTTEER